MSTQGSTSPDQHPWDSWYYDAETKNVIYRTNLPPVISVWLEYSTLRRHPEATPEVQAEVPWECKKALPQEHRHVASTATRAYEADRERVDGLLTSHTKPYEVLTQHGTRLYDESDWADFLSEQAAVTAGSAQA